MGELVWIYIPICFVVIWVAIDLLWYKSCSFFLHGKNDKGRDPNRKPTDLNIYKCDECGFTRWVRTLDPFSFPRPYQGDWAVYNECCPNCGADFKGEAAK